MATLGNFVASRWVLPLQHFRQARWQTTTSLTLNVKQKIEKKREQAVQAGGEKRIAAQHKKVTDSVTH